MAGEQLKLGLLIRVDKDTGEITVVNKQIESVGKTAKSAGDKAKQGAKGFDDLQASLGSFLAAGAVVAFFKDAVDAASELQETQAKFETVFRNNVEQAEGFAKTLVDSFNISEKAAKEYLGTIQDTLVPMGLARQEAAELSNDIIQLAADLSSFNNVPTATVVRDLQSALVGNTETVKKYGVVLKATDIQQRAMADSGKKSADALTNAEKVAAAYQLILAGTSDAQGDVARTSDSYANSMRRLSARIEDAKTRIGDQLIPTIGDLGQTFEDSLPFIERVLTAITGVVRVAIAGMKTWLVIAKEVVESGVEVIFQGVLIIKDLMTGNLAGAKERARELSESLAKNMADVVVAAENGSTQIESAVEETVARIAGTWKDGAEEVNNSQTSIADKAAENDALEAERAEQRKEQARKELKWKDTFDKEFRKLNEKREKKAKKDAEKDAKNKRKDMKDTAAFITDSAIFESERGQVAMRGIQIAQATADTFVAANKAHAAFPPPLGFAMAAAVIAAGLANVQKISGLAGGGRRERETLIRFAENEGETAVPDSKADLFALGMIAASKGGGIFGGVGGGGGQVIVVQNENHFDIAPGGTVEQAEQIAEQLDELLSDNGETAKRLARNVVQTNDDDPNRSVS